MDSQYIFIAKNPILRHCSDSFYNVIKSEETSVNVDYIHSVTFSTSLLLIRKLITSKPGEVLSLFFLAIQSDYLTLMLLLKLVSRGLSKNLRIYYLMHEPRLEKGRVNSIKAFLIYAHQVLFGYLADKVLLPSDKAIAQAKTFVANQKICQVNLAFISISQEILKKNLQQLKCCWDSKTFSMLGTVSSPDKNPQGFLNFANILNQYYPQQARFIRAGRDRGVNVNYDEDLIIQFPSYISDSAKSFLFSLTHFVVVPYSFSTQSGVITEALSYGKLIIVNDIPAFSYLKNLSFAFVVDFNDEDSIRKCADKLFSMNVNDYEDRYWKAVIYFSNNHSETHLAKDLSKIL